MRSEGMAAATAAMLDRINSKIRRFELCGYSVGDAPVMEMSLAESRTLNAALRAAGSGARWIMVMESGVAA